ncbi:MAG: esterase/lipase family protein, partial [Promethearchaeota archaeon]
DRTLLLVHGLNGKSTQFTDFMTNPAFTKFYNNIIAIDYYKDNNFSGNGLQKGFDNNTPIEEIGDAIAQYIIDHPNKFHKTIDIIAYSMGGLVVRSMIKRNYPNLADKGYKIDDIALLATPNHGIKILNIPIFMIILLFSASFILRSYFSFKLILSIFITISLSLFSLIIIYFQRKISGFQGKQLSSSKSNSFIKLLNQFDETPYGIDDINEHYKDITWSTFYGKGFHIGHFLMLLINPLDLLSNSDGIVPCSSVPIEGAANYGPYPLNHDQILRINDPKNAELFTDLYRELTTLRILA